MYLAFFLNEAIYQFSSPARAEVFFSVVRACLIDNDNEPWSDGVDTAPVNGDQAVTADFRDLYGWSPGGTTTSVPGDNWTTEPLFVLHDTDVLPFQQPVHPQARAR